MRKVGVASPAPTLGPGKWILQSTYDKKLVELCKSTPGLKWSGKVWVGYRDAMVTLAERAKAFDLAVSVRGFVRPAAPDWNHLPGRRPYQIEAANFLLWQGREGCVLGDAMGLGKTCSTLTAASRVGRLLIVCPSYVRDVWVREMVKWSARPPPFLPAGVTKKRAPIPAGVETIVIHYDILHAWAAELSAWLAADVNSAVAFDEGHMLQSETSKRSIAAREVAGAAEFKWVLTGTPLTNRPKDLWNTVSVVSPGRLGNFFSFGLRYCCTPEAPIWMGDYSFKPLGAVRVGDEVIGWRDPKKATQHRKLARSRVTAVQTRMARVVRITLASGRIIRCTPDHRWLSGAHTSKLWPWTRAMVGHKLAHVVAPTPPLDPARTWDAGWIAGMFDGEGSAGNSDLRISQSPSHNPAICAEIGAALTRLGIDFTRRSDGKGKCDHWGIVGGRQAMVDFLNKVEPNHIRKCDRAILGSKFKTPDSIISIEEEPEETEVISLTTTTGNYVAWGYASKNCDAHQENVTPEKVVWKFMGRSNLEELGARCKEFMLRRTVADVGLQLPPKTRQIIYLDVGKKARIVPEGRDGASLRRSLDCVADEKIPGVWELLQGHLEAGLSVVVFTWRREVAELLADRVREAGFASECVHGGVSHQRRGLAIERAKSAEGGSVLVATIDSASVGVDFTFASVALFAELTYVPKDLLQAEARVHRFGQGLPVLIQYALGAGTVDEIIASRVIEKLDTFETVIGGTGESLGADLKGDSDTLLADLMGAIEAGK